MNSIYTDYLNIIRNSTSTSTKAICVASDTTDSLVTLSQKHFTAPFLLPYIKTEPALTALKKQTKNMIFQYYQLEHFTQQVASLFEKHNISYILLKGISLAAYYPQPEYRKLGDLDIYIHDPEQLEHAKQILTEHGFAEEKEISDHHITYLYSVPATGSTFILELHFRIVGLYQYEKANQLIDHIYSPRQVVPVSQIINGRSYPVLPPTEYAFYMIHHMLKHYLYSGFGIRLLCDFTFYLKNHSREINFHQLHLWCRESRIFHLYEIILESCRLYLGLPETIDPMVHYPEPDCAIFMEKILNDGDLGTQLPGADSALVYSGSYQKITMFTYFKEGHLQMKVRFPKAGRLPVLWPVLWIATFVIFLYNTHKVRHTTLRQTLRKFKSDNKNTQLIRIFDNSDT